MKDWQDKANEVISRLCNDAWRKTNFKPNGQRYKKRRPYTVPLEAEKLVKILGMKDKAKAEYLAKQIFNYGDCDEF